MVNLNEYFSPVSIERPRYEYLSGPSVFSHNIIIHTENSPIKEISKFRVAIIGVPDGRNSPNPGSEKGPDAIREMLWRLSRIPGKTRIIDLGNLKNGNTFSDTLAGLCDVVTLLFRENIFPVIIGGSSSLVPAIDRAFSAAGSSYTLATVDARIDFHPDKKEPDSCNYLNSIIYNNRSRLVHFINIGYQTFLNDQQTINRLLKRNAELVRIGDVRQSIHLTEPLLRDAEAAVFDISAVRQSDAPGTFNPSPNGFYGEEICLLSRYAGISDRLKIFGLFEVDPGADSRNQTTGLAAQILWFFLEGFSQRQYEAPAVKDTGSGRFTRYHVRLTDLDDDLVFVKSNLTDRWWMEVVSGSDAPGFIACSHEDYLKANSNEVPDRLLKAIARYKL